MYLWKISTPVIVDASVNADNVPLNGLQVQSDSIQESSDTRIPDDDRQQQHVGASKVYYVEYAQNIIPA